MRFPLLLSLLACLALTSGALAQTPKSGGVLTFGVAAEPPTYDCHGGNTFAVLHAVAPHYSTLLKFDLANYPKIVGDLAESWTVSPDQKTFTFKLFPDVTFHDGAKLTSADVKASYERLRQPPAGVLSIRQASFSDIAKIETPDATTVVFTLSQLNAAMLATFASPWNCIYSAEKLAADPKFPERNILGTGPFKFVEHAKGSHWTGTRSNSYFRKGLPYLDGYKAVFVSDPSALVNALQGGSIATEFRGLTPAQRDRLTEALGAQVRIEEMDELVVLLIQFNTEKKPFDDPRVRRALSLAIDRWNGSPGLARSSRLKGVGGVMRPGGPFAASEAELVKLPGFGKDPEAARAEARRLLKEAGHENLTFTLSNRNFSPYTVGGVYAIDQWRRIGVNVEHKQMETAAWTQAMNSGGYDVIVDFSSDFIDEPSFALIKYLSFDKSPINVSRAIDRELDALYEKQQRSTDLKSRLELVRAFEARALTEAASVPLLWTQRILASRSYMKGWRMSASNSLGQDLAEVWLDQ